MKKLILLVMVIMLFSSVALAEKPYFPPVSGLAWDNEQFFFGTYLIVFYVTQEEWKVVVKYYFNQPAGNYAGITISWTNPKTREFIASIIYLPKDNDNTVDMYVLGHEFAHALVATNGLSRTGVDNPDNCPLCRYVIHREFFKDIREMGK